MASAPLLSWDIFAESFQKTLRLLDSFQAINEVAQQNDWMIEWDLEQQLLRERKIILVTDLSLIIRYASNNLYEMNGYQPEEVLGKSPKMFQGPESSNESRRQISNAILRRVSYKGSIINYRKDGTTYNCVIEEYPVWDKKKNLVNFIAFEQVA